MAYNIAHLKKIFLKCSLWNFLFIFKTLFRRRTEIQITSEYFSDGGGIGMNETILFAFPFKSKKPGY